MNTLTLRTNASYCAPHGRNTTPKRREDVLLSHVQEAPGVFAEVLLEMVNDIAPAYPQFGDTVPEYVRLAHAVAELPEGADPRGPLRDFVDALLNACCP
jgi:hypothetical protein